MIHQGILDNDHKGESGRGTLFYLDVTVGGKTTHYEYRLLDWLEGKFDRETVLRPAREENARLIKEQDAKDKIAKKEEFEQRHAKVLISPALDTIIDTVIIRNSKAVSEYQSGKDKALNSLVGMVIKETKNRFDAFSITTALKNKLDGQRTRGH